MNFTLRYSEKFGKDIKSHRKAGNKTALKKINTFLEELVVHPKTGTGHPEQLKGYDGKRWSREITKKHRLVYDIEDDIVVVLVISAWGHYGDK